MCCASSATTLAISTLNQLGRVIVKGLKCIYCRLLCSPGVYRYSWQPPHLPAVPVRGITLISFPHQATSLLACCFFLDISIYLSGFCFGNEIIHTAFFGTEVMVNGLSLVTMTAFTPILRRRSKLSPQDARLDNSPCNSMTPNTALSIPIAGVPPLPEMTQQRFSTSSGIYLRAFHNPTNRNLNFADCARPAADTGTFCSAANLNHVGSQY